VKCRFCGDELDLDKVGFKSFCSSCGHYLHSCVQCGLFERSSGRCRSFTTESVRDLEGMNYCEEFTTKRPEPENTASESRDDVEQSGADRFKNLFRDNESSP